MIKKIISCFFAAALLSACKVDPKINSPLPSDNLMQLQPDGWPQPVYKFEENPITEDRFILGRALFYETMLSKDNSISCGSCHQNFVAFANSDHKVSHGIEGRLGKRNSPGLFNLAWHSSFMHDGGSLHLETQPLAPLANPVEMDENINSVIAKLQVSSKYKALFKSAYGDETVNSQRMLKSLAQFMGLIYSYNSKFDRYKRHEKNAELSERELRGYSLFQAKCNSCHREPLFSDFEFRSNGLKLSSNPAEIDSGRARITGELQDLYKFKTPSLRNVTLTYPYMHDGRFATLQQCLDHYTADKSTKNLINIDPSFITKPIVLTEQDKQDLIAFLGTLADYEFIKDKRFADPNF